MLRNYFTLYHLAFELQELLAGGYVFEVFSQQRNEIVISLITNKGEHLQLFVVTASPRLCLYAREGVNRKQRNTADLMPEIVEKMISEITIDPSDRIIRFMLEDNYTIVLQLFSAKTNVLLQKKQVMISSFKPNTSETVPETGGAAVDRPDILRSLERMVQSPSFFADRLLETTAPDIQGKLGKILPGFDRRLVRELLSRCDDNCTVEKIHDELSSLFYELLDPCPSVQSENGKEPAFSILHNPPANAARFDSVLEGLNVYSIKTWQYLKTRDLVNELGAKLRQKSKKIRSELSHFDPDTLNKQADEYERNGHLLMANLYNESRLNDTITVSNFFDPLSGPLTIRLKPELNLQQNAALFFKKASKARQKIKNGMLRKRTVADQLHMVEKLLSVFSRLSTPAEVKEFYTVNRDTLKILGLEKNTKKEKRESPFRKIPITQQATLYVGKNAKTNEELTFSFAKPDDIWLHARGSSGSHCILRGATVRNITEIRRAAEIAAYHSAARHSELVPVMYTEKKYVRRAGKSHPGKVFLEKENTLLVKPCKE